MFTKYLQVFKRYYQFSANLLIPSDVVDFVHVHQLFCFINFVQIYSVYVLSLILANVSKTVDFSKLTNPVRNCRFSCNFSALSQTNYTAADLSTLLKMNGLSQILSMVVGLSIFFKVVNFVANSSILYYFIISNNTLICTIVCRFTFPWTIPSTIF